MPRTGRGGPRAGRVGVAYGNRTDLNTAQPVQAGPSKRYGQRAQQERAQQAIPLPQTTGPFDRPTERPNEPITAGMPIGPGPGPESLSIPVGADRLADRLRGLYLANPSDETLGLLRRLK